jgi:hypothetical protein
VVVEQVPFVVLGKCMYDSGTHSVRGTGSVSV